MAIYSTEQNHLCNFGRGHHEMLFCEFFLNLDLWFKRKFCLKIFLIKSSCGPFVWRRGTNCSILVEGIMKKISLKLL